MKTTTCRLNLTKLSFIITIFLAGTWGASGQSGKDNNISNSNPNSTKVEDSLHKIFRPTIRRNMGLPVSANEYRYIRGYSYFAFDVLNDDSISVLPELVDPIVKIEDFINYCLSGDTNIYKGIRIYPGLTTDNKLITIMCLAKGGDIPDETLYRIFQNSDYINNPFPAVPSPLDPKNMHDRYTSKVRIFGLKPSYGTEYWKNKISRIYYWKELHELFKSNIIPFNIKDARTFNGYKLKMEIGFIPDFLTGDYNDLDTLEHKEYYEGFTLIFQVIDRNGNPMIDPSATRKPGNRYDFKNLYLEVGSPCPPVCGELHMIK